MSIASVRTAGEGGLDDGLNIAVGSSAKKKTTSSRGRPSANRVHEDAGSRDGRLLNAEGTLARNFKK